MSSDSFEVQDEIRCKLAEQLENVNIKANGLFATSGTISEAPNPGLTISNIGSVGLPLSADDAVKISKACHQAPFGRGERTYVDTSVRKTWELSPDQFHLRNPKWNTLLDTILGRIQTEVGIVASKGSVKAELYKLLLYEKGAFFQKHRE